MDNRAPLSVGRNRVSEITGWAASPRESMRNLLSRKADLLAQTVLARHRTIGGHARGPRMAFRQRQLLWHFGAVERRRSHCCRGPRCIVHRCGRLRWLLFCKRSGQDAPRRSWVPSKWDGRQWWNRAIELSPRDPDVVELLGTKDSYHNRQVASSVRRPAGQEGGLRSPTARHRSVKGSWPI